MSDEAMYDVERFAEVGERFQGVDLQYRRTSTCGGGEWPAPWRARLLTNKAERHEYRLAAFGCSIWEAMRNLVKMVDAVEKSGIPQYHAMDCPARMDVKWRETWRESHARCTCKEPL